MDFESYLAKREQDSEYRETEERLRPILDLADEVFELRMERGWTQAELAERVGTAQANISRLENGLANPTFEFLQKLSKAFGTQLSVHLQRRPTEIETRVVYIEVPEQRYHDLFTNSVEVFRERQVTGQIIKQKVVA